MEVLFAIVILSVGVMGLATMIPYATKNDYRTRMDTTATFVALRQLEQILAQPITVASFTDGSDNPALNVPVLINVTDIDTTDAVGTGAPLDANGDINFTVAVGLLPAGYSRIYNVAPTVGNTVRVNVGGYEVRWNIYQNANRIKTIVVAAVTQGVANALANGTALPPGADSRPANVRAVQMR